MYTLLHTYNYTLLIHHVWAPSASSPLQQSLFGLPARVTDTGDHIEYSPGVAGPSLHSTVAAVEAVEA